MLIIFYSSSVNLDNNKLWNFSSQKCFSKRLQAQTFYQTEWINWVCESSEESFAQYCQRYKLIQSTGCEETALRRLPLYDMIEPSLVLEHAFFFARYYILFIQQHSRIFTVWNYFCSFICFFDQFGSNSRDILVSYNWK